MPWVAFRWWLDPWCRFQLLFDRRHQSWWRPGFLILVVDPNQYVLLLVIWGNGLRRQPSKMSLGPWCQLLWYLWWLLTFLHPSHVLSFQTHPARGQRGWIWAPQGTWATAPTLWQRGQSPVEESLPTTSGWFLLGPRGFGQRVQEHQHTRPYPSPLWEVWLQFGLGLKTRLVWDYSPYEKTITRITITGHHKKTVSKQIHSQMTHMF